MLKVIASKQISNTVEIIITPDPMSTGLPLTYQPLFYVWLLHKVLRLGRWSGRGSLKMGGLLKVGVVV